MNNYYGAALNYTSHQSHLNTFQPFGVINCGFVGVWEHKPTLLKVMGELRVVEVLGSRRPVAPQVSSIETAAPSILTPLDHKEQDSIKRKAPNPHFAAPFI